MRVRGKRVYGAPNQSRTLLLWFSTYDKGDCSPKGDGQTRLAFVPTGAEMKVIKKLLRSVKVIEFRPRRKIVQLRPTFQPKILGFDQDSPGGVLGRPDHLSTSWPASEASKRSAARPGNHSHGFGKGFECGLSTDEVNPGIKRRRHSAPRFCSSGGTFQLCPASL